MQIKQSFLLLVPKNSVINLIVCLSQHDNQESHLIIIKILDRIFHKLVVVVVVVVVVVFGAFAS